MGDFCWDLKIFLPPKKIEKVSSKYNCSFLNLVKTKNVKQLQELELSVLLYGCDYDA
jgi:hypothetical protein